MMNTNENCCFLTLNALMKTFCVNYTRASNEKFLSHGITTSQAEILFFLDASGAQKVHDIALALKMVESNVSNICSRLESTGYVERQRQKDDMRVVKIGLTEMAGPKIAELKETLAAFYEKMQMHISAEDVHEICAGLTKLNTLLEQLLEGSFCRQS